MTPGASALPPGLMPLAVRGHRLSIAGRVVDARTRKVIAGAELVITEGPEAWRMGLAGAPRARTCSLPDGTFHFVDLPEGLYTLSARLPQAATRYGTASLRLEVSSRRGPFPLALLALPPTAAEGVVRGAGEVDGTSGSPSPLAMARVRVMGSGESALTDAEGRFLLHGLEPGARTLQVSARGFAPARLAVRLERGVVKHLELLLRRPPPEGSSKS
ncbi:hypothetical protein Q664_00240 [Archangium violaceum Cb vi76]|uniref:Carboxypeptidase regulatory-like domain-containing protein n=1 Tax=Archangium violaceum Cb vi76 TaxID=1406225 RepID=A0A084T298_9BACT|nr:hypothetical protein Q664_00240 [Archangium violaceum Cb vi76]